MKIHFLPFFVLLFLSQNLQVNAYEQPKRYILTGGPCAGKSSTLLELESMGEKIVHEAATDVCLRLIAKGISEPYKKPGFNEEILRLQKHRQLCTDQTSKRVIFDRSPIDVGVYYDLFGMKRSPEQEKAVQEIHTNHIYEKTIFLLEQLNSFENSTVRPETPEVALAIEKMIEQEYLKQGFRVIHIPMGTVEERAQKILSEINKKS